MSQIINNVDMDKVSQTTANGHKDKSTLKKPVKLQGEWKLDASTGYQFRTELSFEKGKEVIEIDSPSSPPSSSASEDSSLLLELSPSSPPSDSA